MPTPTAACDGELTIAGRASPDALAVEQLSVSRGGRSILADVTLVLHRRTLTAVTGPSGSGKSTLLATLAGLMEPTHGSVTVAGEQMWPGTRRGQARLRLEALGLVMQFGELFPELTVHENVTMPLLMRHESDDQRCSQMLKGLGIEQLANSYPGQLSGGERQRAAIARALIARPAAVLADEPTGSLDERKTHEVFELFRAEVIEADAAALVCTHDPWVASQCDRQYHIASGELVER